MKRFYLIFILHQTLMFNAQSPGFLWAKNFGGTGSAGTGKSIAVGSGGNVYTTGAYIGNMDFDPGPGTFMLSSVAGENDVFISKLDANGNFLWAKSFSGPLSDVPFSIKVDNADNAYITGYFQGTVDFDPGPGVFNITSQGGQDVFICKLDPSGDLVWAKAIGAAATDVAYCVALDASANVYVCGGYKGTPDFDPGAGTFTLSSQGDYDIFVVELDASGNFVMAKSMGGASGESASSMAFDSFGNICLTGTYSGLTDFDPGLGTFTINSLSNSFDAFVVKLDPAGNLIWAKSMGGNYDDFASSLAIDPLDNIISAGNFSISADFDPGTGTVSLGTTGQDDGYISKLDQNGNFLWAIKIGSFLSDAVNSIITDSNGNIFSVGGFQGTIDIDPGPGSFTLSAPMGSNAIFILKLNPSGGFVWAGSISGNNLSQGISVTRDGNNNLHTTGAFRSNPTDFDPDLGINNIQLIGSADIYVLKLAPCCAGLNDYIDTYAALKIYPNPSTDLIQVELINEAERPDSVMLINSIGQVLINEEFDLNKGSAALNLENFQEGIYNIQIVSGEKKYSKKITVIR